jgi:hypothetical protein
MGAQVSFSGCLIENLNDLVCGAWAVAALFNKAFDVQL